MKIKEIKVKNQEIYTNYLQEAEELLALSKPRHVLLSVRQGIEQIVKELCTIANITTVDGEGNYSLLDLIDQLRDCQTITNHDASLLHRARVLCNRAVHFDSTDAPITTTEAQEGVNLLRQASNIPALHRSALQGKAYTAQIYVENGKITAAEQLCQTILAKGKDVVANMYALSCLASISGLDHEGTVITADELRSRAKNGNTICAGSLFLLLTDQNRNLFHIPQTSSIYVGQSVEGIVISQDSNTAYVDFGYSRIGIINRGANFRFYCRIGNRVRCTVNCQLDNGILLDHCELVTRSYCSDAIAIGKQLIHLYNQVCNADPSLTAILQPIIDDIRPGYEYAFKLVATSQKDPEELKSSIESISICIASSTAALAGLWAYIFLHILFRKILYPDTVCNGLGAEHFLSVGLCIISLLIAGITYPIVRRGQEVSFHNSINRTTLASVTICGSIVIFINCLVYSFFRLLPNYSHSLIFLLCPFIMFGYGAIAFYLLPRSIASSKQSIKKLQRELQELEHNDDDFIS